MTPSRATLVDVVRVLDAGLLHRLAGALHGAADAGLADEHVVRLFGEHEAAGARERIEAGLREAFELHLAVAVGEEGEHVEREPVRRRLVEGAEHARLVGVAGAALQQLLGLLAAVAAEIFLQDVDHRPEMAAFLDVDLEHVAHVVERGRGLAEMALLLDRGRLGVALDDDQAAQHGAVFARHLLPGRLAEVLAERNLAALVLAERAECPSGSPASSRSRTWPSPWDRPRPRCADRPAPPGSLPAPWSSTSRCSRDASPRARAAPGDPR